MQKKTLMGAVRALLLLMIGGGAIAWTWSRQSEDEEAPPTTADWAGLVNAGDTDERKLALMNLLPESPEETGLAINAATRALKDPEAEVRNEAAVTLARLAVPSSGESAFDPDRVRAVSKILVRTFRDDRDSTVRGAAAASLSLIVGALEKGGVHPMDLSEDHPLNPRKLVPAFDAALLNDPENQMALITAIERLGPLPMKATPGVLKTLDAPTHAVRAQTLKALSHFSGGIDPAIPVLLGDVVSNSDRFPPDYEAIARHMHPSPEAVPVLVEALGNSNGVIRETAATLLAGIEPPPRSAASALMVAVDRELSVPEDAIKNEKAGRGPAPKGGMAPNSGIMRTALRPGLVSPDLARALAKSAPPEESLPRLLKLLNRKNRVSRTAAIEGLALLGPAAAPAVPELRKLLGDGDRRVKRAAKSALGKIEPQPSTNEEAKPS